MLNKKRVLLPPSQARPLIFNARPVQQSFPSFGRGVYSRAIRLFTTLLYCLHTSKTQTAIFFPFQFSFPREVRNHNSIFLQTRRLSLVRGLPTTSSRPAGRANVCYWHQVQQCPRLGACTPHCGCRSVCLSVCSFNHTNKPTSR